MARVATRGENRGQLLLVAAVGLAVLFVSLALILNTAIYAEAVETDDSTHRNEHEAAEYQYSVRRGVSGIVTTVNEHDHSSYDALNENLSDQVADWNELASRQNSIGATATNVSVASAINGTRIVQNNESRHFTNRTGATNWTPAGNVSNVRGFRMNVSADSLYESDNETCTETSDCFYAEVENGSDSWRFFVSATDNGTNISVRAVNASGESETCTTAGESAWINLTSGTLDGTDCPALSVGEGVAGPYNVTYANGDHIAGSYELTVDRRLSSDPHYSVDASPSVSPALFAVNVTVTYRSSELLYTTEIRVEPSETDE